MPVLVIHPPEGPSQQVELERKPQVLGRGEEADIRIDDPKVSARHLRIRPTEGEGWVIRDLGSTRGTKRQGKRVLRAVIADGDRLELGATRVTYHREAPPAAAAGPLVGGTLDLKPTSGAAPAAPPPPPPPPAEAPRDPVVPLDHKAARRGWALLVAGVAAVLAVFLTVAPKANDARKEAQTRRELRKVLETRDLGFEAFEIEAQEFLTNHPRSEDAGALREYVEGVRQRETARSLAGQRLLALTQNLYGLPESEVRRELIALGRTVPDDRGLLQQVQLALEALDRRQTSDEGSALDLLLASARGQVAAGEPAGALRRLTAFRRLWPVLGREAMGRLQVVEDETVAALRALQKEALAQAEAMPDGAEARRLLARAWRGLEGTPQAEAVADALRYTRTRRKRPTSGTGTPGSTTPEEPETIAPILAKAAEAENFARARQWTKAREAFLALVPQVGKGLLQTEWENRARELSHILGLIARLKQDAESGKRVALPSGKATVQHADDKGVRLARGDDTSDVLWAAVPEDELLEILAPKKPEPTDRLGLAVLAAELGRREKVVEVLVPLFEAKKDLAEANGLVARYLYGRAEAPKGGYRAHRGAIVDEQGYQERVRIEEIGQFRDKAKGFLARVKKENAFKKLGKLRQMRTTLDERRRYALLGIFDEVHYPYPVNKQSIQYQAVQKEIDRRIGQVREIWDDPYKVTISRKGSLGRTLEQWNEALGEITKRRGNVKDLEAQIAPYLDYVTDEPINIRSFWLSPAEKKRTAYSRWVMEVYNPGQTQEAALSESRQTRVTNEYRMMMGYWAHVKPGPANFDAIDDSSVVRVLDEGKVMNTRPLVAVRIDDRLVRSSRLHSLDMQKRGFFSHHAPPNEHTGEPGTSPFERMQKAGYKGNGASENIANGASNAEQAHWMWCHSSGHHRNILSSWTDQGVGQAGRYWTQNFGIGGGAKPVIEKE